jgi:hypothetical protein
MTPAVVRLPSLEFKLQYSKKKKKIWFCELGFCKLGFVCFVVIPAPWATSLKKKKKGKEKIQFCYFQICTVEIYKK